MAVIVSRTWERDWYRATLDAPAWKGPLRVTEAEAEADLAREEGRRRGGTGSLRAPAGWAARDRAGLFLGADGNPRHQDGRGLWWNNTLDKVPLHATEADALAVPNAAGAVQVYLFRGTRYADLGWRLFSAHGAVAALDTRGDPVVGGRPYWWGGADGARRVYVSADFDLRDLDTGRWCGQAFGPFDPVDAPVNPAEWYAAGVRW